MFHTSCQAEKVLEKCLEQIVNVIDLDRIEAGKRKQSDAWNFRPVERPPLTIISPAPGLWPSFKYREIFEDQAKMLISQLGVVYFHCLARDDSVPSVRADYGVGVIPSAFGCRIHVPDDDMPWVGEGVFDKDDLDPGKLREPSFEEGLTKRVVNTERYFLEKLEGTGIRVYLADTQGPFNLAHEIAKDKVFTALYRRPEALKDILSKVTDAYIEFTKIQKRAIGEPLDQGAHGWDRSDGPSGIWMNRGGVRLCDDSAVLVSPEHFGEFCAPFNQRCLAPFKGGMWHSCGDVNHLFQEVVATPGVHAIHLGNPEMHSFDELRKITYENRICLIWKDRLSSQESTEEWVARFTQAVGEDRTGIIFSIGVRNMNEAKKLQSTWELAYA